MVAKGIKTKDVQTKAGKHIDKIIGQASKDSPFVKVGVQEKDGAKEKKQRDQGEADNMVRLLLVAIVQEFGTDKAGKNKDITIPERSYIRSTADEKKKEWAKLNDELLTKIFKGMSIEKALKIQGQRMRADIQKKIEAIEDPILKLATILAKGSSKPLIDTAQLIQSIREQVVKKKIGGFGV